MLAEAQALAHLGIWEWEIASNELTWSDELYQILGLAPGEIPATFEALLARVHGDDLTSVKSYFARARREHSPLGIEYRIVRPTGEIRTLQARVRSTFDERGTLLRLIGTDQDITETKELAARLVFSDRMVSIGTLAGGVAHEINNPLATISANLTMLAETREDAATREALQAVERIRNIVRGLMAFGRVDENQRQPLDVDHILELAIGMTSNEIRHRARLLKQLGGPPHVNANEARLGHVFINLLVNAAEAIPEGHADRHEIRVTTRTDGAGWAVVEIADSGAGIPREVQHRIFDPFFTTKPVGKGTGLGLSIAHGIVRSLGGDITFRSEPGKGSTFSVALPPSSDKPRRRAPSDQPRITGERRGSVLIVDDEVLFANSLRRLFAAEHQVTVVNSGRDALEKLKAGERFDVILCDLMMPEITGADVHAALVEHAPEQAERIIFITGGAFSPASQQFLERVTNLCFEKPCDLQELRAAVRRRIAAGRG
jgi:PAS domain S-box-containing protein